MAVHPHSRGEYAARKSSACFASGSSPLARGIPEALPPAVHFARFIPTRAGNTRSGRSAGRSVTVHPHSRGEYILALGGLVQRFGSSPLARGIPITQLLGSWLHTVHPHSRGEYEDHGCATLSKAGSSPLARGIPVDHTFHGHALRFIPTRAGNTLLLTPRRITATVHPHSRGEYYGRLIAGTLGAGSSPLARGIRQHPPL